MQEDAKSIGTGPGDFPRNEEVQERKPKRGPSRTAGKTHYAVEPAMRSSVSGLCNQLWQGLPVGMSDEVCGDFLRAKRMARATFRRWQGPRHRNPITKMRGRKKELVPMSLIS